MKNFFRLAGVVATLALIAASSGAQAQDDQGDQSATFQTFYDQLGNQGTWIQTDTYGYVWQPPVTDPNWQPYTDGHWVYTDQGWTWVSDDSWGWATDHYGRWVNIDGTGWCWVPGYTWAPAWVSWRYGDGYAGWAPLPPDTEPGIDFDADGLFGFDFGFHIGDDCDTDYGIGPECYNFCPVGDLGDSDYRGHYLNRNDNFRMINRTRNVTNINVGRRGAQAAGRIGRVTVGGPSLAEVNAHSHTPVRQVNFARSNQVGRAGLRGNSLAVYAPRVAHQTGETFHPRSVGARLSNVTVNRGTDINHPLQVNSRVQAQGATPQQMQAARSAQAHPGPGVATANTHFTHTLSRPLSTMQPAETAAAPVTHDENADRPLTSDGSSTLTGLSAEHETERRSAAGHSNGGASAFTGMGGSHQAGVSHSSGSGASHSSFGSFFHSGGSAQHQESAPVHHASPSMFHASAVHSGGSPEHHESAPVHHASPSVFHAQASHSGGGGGHPSGGGGHGGGHPGGGGHPSGNGGNKK